MDFLFRSPLGHRGSAPVGCLLLSLLSLTASAAELAPADRAALLNQLQQTRTNEPSLRADFTEERTTHLLSQPVSVEGTVQFKAPDKFRREVKGHNPSLTVCDGKTMWIYYPAFNEAETYTIGQRAVFDDALTAFNAGLNFQRIEESYNFKAFSEKNGYKLHLVPKRANIKRVLEELTVWMDSNLIPLRTEAKLPKGDRIVTNYRNAVRTPLPDSDFEFKPPEGSHVSHPLGK